MFFVRLVLILALTGSAFAQDLPMPPSSPQKLSDCSAFLAQARTALTNARVAAFERAASAYGGQPYYPDLRIVLEAELMFENSLSLADGVFLADRRCHRQVNSGKLAGLETAVLGVFMLADADERESSIDRGRRTSLLVTSLVGGDLVAINTRLSDAESQIATLRGHPGAASEFSDQLEQMHRRWRREFDQSVNNTRPVPDDALSQQLRDVMSGQP